MIKFNSIGLSLIVALSFVIYSPITMANVNISDAITVNPVLIGVALTFVLFLLCFVLYVLFRFRLFQSKINNSEERLKLSLWASGDELWDWDIKQRQIFRTSASGVYSLPSVAPDVFPPNKSLIHPNDVQRVSQSLQLHLSGELTSFECAYRLKDDNSNWIWVLDKGKVVERSNSGEPLRMTGTFKDIHHLKQTEKDLKIFAQSIESISEGVIIFDPQLNVVHVNPGFIAITGQDSQALIGKKYDFKVMSMSMVQEVKAKVDLSGHWQGDIKGNRQNGQSYSAIVTVNSVLDENGMLSHYVAVITDTTKRKKAEARLVKVASIDNLTSLPNRSVFFSRLQKCVDNKVSTAVLVFDLDDFKKINDSLGHQFGDELLVQIAKRITVMLGINDSLYRLGGDEFALVMEKTNDIHKITNVAKKVLAKLALPFKIQQHEIVVAGSMGIVLYPDDGVQPQTLLKNADTAMYHAKEAGNRYLFFNSDMNKQAVKRLQIENLIRHGLKEDFFEVFYQAKLDIKTKKLKGMEALVRFITPKKGLISPATFIPISEETGQIVEIGDLVLKKSCKDMKRWADMGLVDGRVAVNLSARQFTLPNLIDRIDVILAETKLDPRYLELEITEGTVMDNPKSAIKIMHQIRDRGIHLALDDFGTGYSSLSYLAKFPLNTLKIDRAFVNESNTKVGKAMIDTIVTIARNLGLSTVAEGVETEVQSQIMADMECDLVQGYLYSKPLSAEDFESYLISLE